MENTAVSITARDGTAIALRLTNSSGLIDPVPIPTPNAAAGETPDTGMLPYTLISINARAPGFEQIEAKEIQVFPGIVTRQDLALVPLSELPDRWDQRIVLNTPPQQL